jgi:serine/threonine protein kinase
MKDTVSQRFRLGVFEIDLRAGEVRDGGHAVVLPEQPFQILRMLIEHPGELVTRDEIQKALWPNDTVVEFDHSINAAVNKLRQALGDSAGAPRYVETVARRGYRLMMKPEPIAASLLSDSGEEVAQAGLSPPADAAQGANLIGKKVSHYRVASVIGVGGMGLVYEAEDLKLGRAVALKFLPEDLAQDTAALQRFEREARAASSLDHPNICTIYEVEEHESQPFIVMQRLRGETLRDRLANLNSAQESLSVKELLDIAIQICDGLAAAHAKGIVHRDIKPANIFLSTNGPVKILDFGVAKLVEAPDFSPANDAALKEHGFSLAAAASDLHERGNQSSAGLIPAPEGEDGFYGTAKAVPLQNNDDAHSRASEGAPLQSAAAAAAPAKAETILTRTGMKLGTAGYMSPEQIRGEPLDARTDIFSFGLVLYEMATGERAFTGETETILHAAIQNQSPVPLRQRNAALPPKLESIVNRAIEKDPEQRYQGAAQMRRSRRRGYRGRNSRGRETT